MAKTVTLLQFNNYFNREVKGETYSDLGDYLANGANVCGQIKNMTLWNPNDGVDTTITSILDLYAIPDYAVVEEDGVIIQRWFVIEATRSRASQYRLKLHRDVIADNFDKIMANSDNYVLRGWCDVSNPAIYNQESITFNQIKSAQVPLYDKSCTPWIVAYYVSNAADEEKTIEFKPQSANVVYKFTIPAGGFRNSDGVPYTILYLPYESITANDKSGVIQIQTNQNYNVSRAAATALSKEFTGAGKLLDLQILPFCPNPVILDGYREVSFSVGLIPNVKITDSTGNLAGYIFTTTNTNATGNIYHISGGAGTPWTEEFYNLTVNDIKTENQTTFARIVSPNGNGVFEFTPAKMVYSNNSKIGFQYQMTPMPYQPYIKVEPTNFGRLYGRNYQDTRGLICGGDFSIPQISDSWTTYQIQNKNYEKMFNRQIDSMDLQNKWARRQDIASAATGVFSAAVGGGMVGGVAGGVVSGLASAAAGGLDIYANEQIRADTKDATIKQFNWQNENIQALPYGVSKSTNFNAEQPKVPYMEIYTCTDEEKTNFQQYLALRDYTINRYGKFTDYVKPSGRTFIRGTIIRLSGIYDDTHYLASIADEVKQGFYTDAQNGG